MKLIILLFATITLLSAQNKKYNYTTEKALTEDQVVSLVKYCAKNKSIYTIEVDEKNKIVSVETKGYVDPKTIESILNNSGFVFTLVTLNPAKTSTTNAQSKIR